MEGNNSADCTNYHTLTSPPQTWSTSNFPTECADIAYTDSFERTYKKNVACSTTECVNDCY